MIAAALFLLLLIVVLGLGEMEPRPGARFGRWVLVSIEGDTALLTDGVDDLYVTRSRLRKGKLP